LLFGPEKIRVKTIHDILALSFVLHQSHVPQHPQMVRHVRQVLAQKARQLTNVFRSGSQALDDLEPLAVGQGFKESGTLVGSEGVTHAVLARFAKAEAISSVLAHAMVIPGRRAHANHKRRAATVRERSCTERSPNGTVEIEWSADGSPTSLTKATHRR
jgi:hypothetical protein